MEICASERCTGCGACQNICPKNSITMFFNKDGFLHPVIDSNSCINCFACKAVCPVNHPVPLKTKNIAFKARCLEEDILKRSTSGGVFTVLAKEILSQGGYVFGAELTENLMVKHSGTNDQEYIRRYCGSKYVQSNTEFTFQKTKQILTEGKPVLYTGTPCQIAGLKNYLGQEYEGLITCEFICHGVGSSKVFDLYKEDIEKTYAKKITNIKFRNKKHGYINGRLQFQFQFQDGTTIEDLSYKNPFGFGFASDLITRESCVTCEYTRIERTSDLTLADYSGDDLSDYEKQYGVSFLLINTEKGINLINQCEENFLLQRKSMDFVIGSSYHLTQKSKRNLLREQFFIDLEGMPYEHLREKYLIPRKLNFIKRVELKIKKLL